MLELIDSLSASLPWFLRLDGAPYLHDMMAGWGAAQGLIPGDDWTRLFLVLYRWILVLGAVWGVCVALVVTKRSARGRFRGDPERYRDAVVKGLLHVGAAALGGAALVLALFLVVAMGPGPVIWLATAYALFRAGRVVLGRLRREGRSINTAIPIRRRNSPRAFIPERSRPPPR
jgi:hypothetical protein